MDIKILYWTQNEAAKTIMKEFEKLGVDVPVIRIEKNFLYLINEDIEGAQGRGGAGAPTDLFIVPSTHRSEAGKKSLTIHATGNFGNADCGGEPMRLNPTSPEAIAIGLRSMAKQVAGCGLEVAGIKTPNPQPRTSNLGLDGYEVCMEVTHHGPTLDVPLVFIEIGSSENEWKDEEAGKVVANAMKEIIEWGAQERSGAGAQMENYIGFGGPHYAPSFTQIILENPTVAIGHILPNYHAEHITKDIVQQMLEKSNAKKAVFDWKGIKSEARGKAIKILEELGVEYCKTSELH